MAHPALAQTEHRPWELPQGPWMWRESWVDLLFAHWRVPVEVIRPYVPKTLRVQGAEAVDAVAPTVKASNGAGASSLLDALTGPDELAPGEGTKPTTPKPAARRPLGRCPMRLRCVFAPHNTEPNTVMSLRPGRDAGSPQELGRLDRSRRPPSCRWPR
ncbi:MAG: DUF2071 domain-containing protein [Polyangiaceae bacterium]|nr:DUF2071 domain-containing protein [Polyangiaceae bacterium]